MGLPLVPTPSWFTTTNQLCYRFCSGKLTRLQLFLSSTQSIPVLYLHPLVPGPLQWLPTLFPCWQPPGCHQRQYHSLLKTFSGSLLPMRKRSKLLRLAHKALRDSGLPFTGLLHSPVTDCSGPLSTPQVRLVRFNFHDSTHMIVSSTNPLLPALSFAVSLRFHSEVTFCKKSALIL